MRGSIRFLNCLAIAAAVLVTGCHSHPPQPPVGKNVIRGQARVLDVDTTLGTVTLDMNGTILNGYWTTEYVRAQSGSTVSGGPLQGSVGTYQETISQPIPFPAKAGDWIAFRGIKTGDEVKVSYVQVLSHLSP